MPSLYHCLGGINKPLSIYFIEGALKMKKIIIVMIVVLMLGILAKKIKKDMIAPVSEYKKITSEEAKEMIDGEDVIILDVRTPEEYKQGHIEGALLLPDYDLEDLAESELPDKDAKILVYCRSGNRSRSASKVLINMGYTEVYDFGGINNWGYDTVKGE